MTPEQWLQLHFERCWPWLAAALERQPIKTHEKEHVWQALETGKAQIWPTKNSVCLTEIVKHPTGLTVMHGWLAGGDMDEIKKTVKAIEAHAAKIGCGACSISGRKGWLRAFEGYQDAGTMMVKEIK